MIYDTIIIGSGLAGLTASIYSSRYKTNNLVIGKLPGGTINLAHKVENFPGFPSITGGELAQKIITQAKGLGAEILPDFVAKVEKVGGPAYRQAGFAVETESGKKFTAKTLIATTGTERRKLGVPGEKEYLGRGVSYCTHCDAPFFKGKTAAMIGGSNAAVSGAIHLSEYAAKVYIIYRKAELRAEPVWVEEALKNPKIEVIYNTNVLKILGDKGEQGNKVGAVELDNPYKGEKILPLDGLFVEIGGVPSTNYLVPLGVELDENGFVKVNEKMETSVPGVFAAGDLTTQSLILMQAVTACAQGAIAASSAFKYLRSRR